MEKPLQFEEMKKNVGKRIKKARLNKGITQEKFAEMLEVDFRHVSGIETGNNTPSLKLLHKISGCLDVHISHLFTNTLIFQEVDQLKANINDVISDYFGK